MDTDFTIEQQEFLNEVYTERMIIISDCLDEMHDYFNSNDAE